MSNTTHFYAVEPDALRSHWDPDDFFPPKPGLLWCGNAFETGYVFRDQLDRIVEPYLSPSLRSVLAGEAQTVVHPAVELLRTNEVGLEITPFSSVEFAELRMGVRSALQFADWDTYDPQDDDWIAFADDRTVGEFYVLAEFV